MVDICWTDGEEGVEGDCANAQGASANAAAPAPSRLERENIIRSLVKVCVPAQPVRQKEISLDQRRFPLKLAGIGLARRQATR